MEAETICAPVPTFLADERAERNELHRSARVVVVGHRCGAALTIVGVGHGRIIRRYVIRCRWPVVALCRRSVGGRGLRVVVVLLRRVVSLRGVVLLRRVVSLRGVVLLRRVVS